MYESGQISASPKSASVTTKLLGVFLVALAIMGFRHFGGFELLSPNNAETAPVVSEPFDVGVVRSFNISSLTYTYSDVIYNPDVVKLPVVNATLPFSESHIGIQYRGKMEIGIDASQIKVSQNGQRVIIEIPKAKILSHEIEGTPEILFNVSGLLNSNKPEEVLPLVFEVGKPKMEASARQNFLDVAQISAADQLKSFLDQVTSGEYEFVIRTL